MWFDLGTAFFTQATATRRVLPHNRHTNFKYNCHLIIKYRQQQQQQGAHRTMQNMCACVNVVGKRREQQQQQQM